MEKQKKVRVQIQGLRIHPHYYARPFNIEDRLHHHMTQFSRMVSMLALAALFIFIAFMPDKFAFLIHISILSLCLAAIIFIGNQANKAAADFKKRRDFERDKNRNVTYCRVYKSEAGKTRSGKTYG